MSLVEVPVSPDRVAPSGEAMVRVFHWAAWLALLSVVVFVVLAERFRPRLPRGVRVYQDIVYRRSAGHAVRLDLYVPEGAVPPGGRPVVLAIHGGGWRGGSKTRYGREIARLAKYGCVVVAPDYRLSRPGAPSWPANFEDVRAAVRWVRRHAVEYGADPNRIAALGASAGAHLAILLGTDSDPANLRKSGIQDDTGPGLNQPSARVQAVIAFYGPTDLRSVLRDNPSAVIPVALLLGGSPAQLPAQYEAASPARHVTADDPPMLLVYGQADRLVPPDQAKQLRAALEKAGVPHRLILLQAGHGFGLRVGGRDLVPDILDFLATVWKH